VYWNGLNPTQNNFSILGTVDAFTFTYQTTAVTSGVVYSFEVLATNAVGDGPLSSPLQVKAAQVPDAPNQPTLINQMPDSISFSWIPPND
jgi:hypothetical protein